MKRASGGLKRAVIALAITSIVLTCIHYPWNSDEPDVSRLLGEGRKYYQQAYAAGDARINYPPARSGASTPPQLGPVTDFVKQYKLEDKRVLEIGAGVGTLQDVVERYVGLDIAESAARNFHKPFVQGSATDLPFADSQFDAIWTIWTLEHVPNPEMALREMRRVVVNGGFLYIDPAWDVPTWRSRGYDVLPESQLDIWGKFMRLVVTPVRTSLPYVMLHRIPAHAIRAASWQLSGGGPTRLQYTRLTPNYERFLGPDSDAVNLLDAFETALWYRSRGDQCLNCASGLHQVVRTWGHPLIIQVHK